MTYFPLFFKKILAYSTNKVEKYGARYIAFGVFSLINYMIPLYMFSHHYTKNISVQIIRMTAIVLNFLLAISDAWSGSSKKYLPLYWHFTIMFCLPFMVTYMTFSDGISMFWIINIALALMLGLILIDFTSFLIIYPTGITFAIILYNVLGYEFESNMPNYLLYPSFYLIFFIFAITATFFRDKEREQEEKIKAMRALAGSIAHEIRTPILTVMMTVKNINPSARTKNELEIFEKNKDSVEKEIKYILSMTDIILTRLSGDAAPLNCKPVSVKNFINKTIKNYPFVENESNLVHMNIIEDFRFSINEHIMTHVVFNIIQNALYQIKKVQKGEIFITVKCSGRKNIISIKDTATGIPQSKIGKIFTPFTTYKNSGTGIGLDFCKRFIIAMNGDLTCQSEYGKYAEFIMEFKNERL